MSSMQITSTDIVGKKIIAEKEAKELAIADDLFFDTQQKKVVAILTGSRQGLQDAKAVALPKVKSIKDVIVLSSEKDLVPAMQILQPKKDNAGNARTLVGSDLVTEKGQELGDLTKISFNAKSGEIIEASGEKDGKQKSTKVSKVVATGPDITVVKGEEKKQQQQGPLEQLKKIFQ